MGRNSGCGNRVKEWHAQIDSSFPQDEKSFSESEVRVRTAVDVVRSHSDGIIIRSYFSFPRRPSWHERRLRAKHILRLWIFHRLQRGWNHCHYISFAQWAQIRDRCCRSSSFHLLTTFHFLSCEWKLILINSPLAVEFVLPVSFWFSLLL